MPLIPKNRMSAEKQLAAARAQLAANEKELKVTQRREVQAKLKRTMKFLRRRIRKLEAACEASNAPPVTEDSFFSKWWQLNAVNRSD